MQTLTGAGPGELAWLEVPDRALISCGDRRPEQQPDAGAKGQGQ